jgi:hypothetical protein
MMEALSSCETSALRTAKRLNIPEDAILHKTLGFSAYGNETNNLMTGSLFLQAKFTAWLLSSSK